MLSYEMRGPESGPLVVFLHAGGVCRWMWEDVLLHAPDIRALLIDLPGHGKSRNIAWRSIADVAGQVEEVIQEVAGDRVCHLAALSLGSYVGAHVLARGRVDCVSAMLSGMHAGAMKRKTLMKIMSALMVPLSNKRFMARKTAQMMVGPDGDIDAYVASATQARTVPLARAVFDVLDFELPPALAQTQARVLFCAGADENDMILSGLDRLAAFVPHGQVMRVAGGGHGWPGKDPGLFARTLQDHIAT